MAAGPVFAAQLQTWIAQVVRDRSLWKHSTSLRLAMLIAAHLNRKSLEAYPSQLRLARLLGVKEEAVRRAALTLRDAGHLSFVSGRGQGIATRYRPIIRDGNPLSLEEGFHGQKSRPGSNENPSSGASKPLLLEEGGTLGTLSTPPFGRSGPPAVAVGPSDGETIQAFAWRIAKAFPSKRGGMQKAVAAVSAFLSEGHATPAEIEDGLRLWRPWFDAILAENGHHSGYTLSGWLERGDFRFSPTEVHGWIPESGEFLS